jgi:PAS domain S-box-containing protein
MSQYLSGTHLLTALRDDPNTLVFVIDLAGNLLETNDGFARMTNYRSAGPGEKWLWDFLSPDDAEKTKNLFTPAATIPHCLSQQWQIPQGVTIYVDWSAYPFVDESGGHRLLCIGKEVSAHQQKIAYLLQKEAWLERIQTISNIGYWEHHLEENIMQYSKQTARIYGLSLERDVVDHDQLGINLLEAPYSMDSLLQLMVPQERENFRLKLQALLQARLPYEVVYTLQTEGKMRRILASGEFVRDQGGKVTRVMGISKDITEQYEYEKQLQYKEKLLNSVSEAIIATDVHFNITSWNKGAEQVYGWKAEEVMGKDARTILQTSYLEGVDKESVIKELIEKGSFRNRVFQRRKDGTLLRIFSNSTRLLDEKNELLGFVGLNQDISHLVQLEENALNYQAQLQIIIDNSPDSIFLTDAEGRILVKNSTFEKIFFERFGLNPRKGDKLTQIHPSELRAFTQHNLNRAAEGKPFAFEYSYLDKNGNTQTADTSICPVLNPDGKVNCIVFYSKNITLRKKIEAQTLLDTVEAQKNKSALLLEGQEQERARLIKELHDGIGQMLNVLKLKIDSWLGKPGAQAQELSDISEFTSLIIADIKNLVHDSMPYQLEHLGLAEAIRNLVAQYELQQKLNITFNVWVNVKNQHFGKGIEVFIYRVLQECVHNAVKHSGGNRITVQLTQLEGELLLMAEDNGVGFDLAEVLRQKQSPGGLRNIMERCSLAGADLEIDTQPGHGCTINIKVLL